MNLLPIVVRADWGAEPARGRVPMKHPVPIVVLSFNTGVEPCLNHEDCVLSMKRLQETHMRKGLLDVHYNFVVGGDGLIYEGRGFHFQSSRNPESPNSHGKRLDIGYMGDLSKDPFQPPHVTVTPILRLIHYAANNKFITMVWDVIEDKELIRGYPYVKDINIL